MNDKSRPQQNHPSPEKPVAKEKKIGETGDEKFPGPHVGSSDAFLQTENTGSTDADNVSDERLDDLLDED